MSLENSIEKLALALSAMAAALQTSTRDITALGDKLELEPAEEPTKPAAKAKPKPKPAAKTKPPADTEGEEVELTLDQVRSAAMAADRELTRDALSRFGAAKLSQLVPADYVAFVGMLEKGEA